MDCSGTRGLRREATTRLLQKSRKETLVACNSKLSWFSTPLENDKNSLVF